MRIVKSTFLAVGISFGAALPVRAQASAAPGCWAIAVGEWAPSPGSDSVLYNPKPTWLRLAADTSGEYFQAARRPNRPPSQLPLDSLRAFWRPVGPDSIEVWLPVWWSTGVRARLRVAGDSLTGHAAIYVDVSPHADPRAVVHGRRVDCGRAVPNDR